MTIRLNRGRTALTLALALLAVLWFKLQPGLLLASLVLPALAPLHVVLVIAMVCITVAGIFRMLLRGK